MNEEIRGETKKTVDLDEAHEAHEATPKQAQADKTYAASPARARDQQLPPRNLNEEIKAKAKKLAADAMAKDKKERERRRYVEGRAWDIHEKLLLCKPFDVDAVRREFSEEEEVREVKRLVREWGVVARKM